MIVSWAYNQQSFTHAILKLCCLKHPPELDVVGFMIIVLYVY
jgi:hypothetical protein